MPDDVQYFCKACNDEEVPEWLNSVRQEIQAGFIYVIMPDFDSVLIFCLYNITYFYPFKTYIYRSSTVFHFILYSISLCHATPTSFHDWVCITFFFQIFDTVVTSTHYKVIQKYFEQVSYSLKLLKIYINEHIKNIHYFVWTRSIFFGSVGKRKLHIFFTNYIFMYL